MCRGTSSIRHRDSENGPPMTQVSTTPSEDSLTVLVTYTGTAVEYYVPLDFAFSTSVTTSVVRAQTLNPEFETLNPKF